MAALPTSQIMTQPPKPYDPVKSVVGMFNGTVIRLGHFFKDPEKYGADTKVVLSQTTKRYQDALDDCEIQILEAKWYLEHQLKLNKARREAQVEKEDVTSAKRKLDAFKEGQNVNSIADGPEDQPAKRLRVEENRAAKIADTEPPDLSAEEILESVTIEAPTASNTTKSKIETTTLDNSNKSAAAIKLASSPKALPEHQPPPAPMAATSFESRPSTSYGGGGGGPPSQSGQNSPAEDFNFESMFGEPSGDPNDAGINFDNMDLSNTDAVGGNFNDDSNVFSLGDSSLNNLLPGLESYAKQGAGDAGDGTGGFDFGNPGGMEASTGNEFDLPDLGSSNFDDLLNLNDSTFTIGDDGGEDLFKDGELMNLQDLDTSFFDNP